MSIGQIASALFRAAGLLNSDQIESKPFPGFPLPTISGDEWNREPGCRLEGQCRGHMHGIEGPQPDGLDEFFGLTQNPGSPPRNKRVRVSSKLTLLPLPSLTA